jgi:4'-phosphopantetheinyl transferase
MVATTARADRAGAFAAGGTEPLVSVWVFDVGTVPGPWFDELAPEERERGRRFRRRADADRFLATRAALRVLIGERVRRAPRDVRFRFGPKGKPYLDASLSDATRFNVSHSGNLAVIAMSRGRSVGVDLEQHRTLPDLLDLVRNTFHPWEKSQWLSLKKAEQEGAFFRCWTRKEAFLKATGEGLTGGMGSFAVSFLRDERPRLVLADHVPGAVDAWKIADISPRSGFTAALVAEGQDWRCRSLEL